MKKSFGQHLLIDKNHLKKIINNVDLSQEDIVLEIGAGSGLLTCELAKKVNKVFAVELEREIIEKLKRNLKLSQIENVEIIQSDFLKLYLKSISKKPFKVLGNIPYNITSQILIKLFGEIDSPAPHLDLLSEVYLMLQLEVAKRVVASYGTKAYSPLTLLVQYFTNPEILYKVPKTAFFPIPRVDSALVKFHVKKKPQELENPTLLKNIIRTSFQQRRKKIINSLTAFIDDKALITNTLKKINLNCDLRPEDLNFNQYVEISNAFSQLQAFV